MCQFFLVLFALGVLGIRSASFAEDRARPDKERVDFQSAFAPLLGDFQREVLKSKIRQKDYIPPEEPRNVIRYVRGKNGIQFPKPEEIRQLQISPELRKKIEERAEQLFKEAEKKITAPARLSTCKESQTSKEDMDFGEPGVGDDEVTFYDVLYMEKEEVPNLTMEVFGQHTQIRAFVQNSTDLMSMGIAGIGIPCLPYRVRITRKAIFFDQGSNALRNYDRTGPYTGEFHAIMSNRLGRGL